MASEIRVDKINSLSGVGTVTLSPTGVDIAGITTAATLRATTGIVTSLTAGSLTSLGAVSGTTGTFSAAVSGTTGTFSAAVSGTTGTFSGAVSGTTGTFTGDVSIPDTIVHTGDTNTKIRFPAADTITAETGGSERVRIDSAGRFLLNMSSSITGGKFQVNNQFNTFFAATNDANGAFLQLEKTRSTSPGSYTIVQDGDTLGELQFKGSNGSASVVGANIKAIVNGTPGSGNDLPTDLAFRTMPDGSGSTVERMRIDSSGRVLIGGTSNPSGASTRTLNLIATSASEAALVFSRSNSLGGSTTGQDIKLQTNGDLTFDVHNVGEKVRFRSAGGITFNGDTAAANALDDYEEGTWTPTISPTGGSFTTINYQEQHGFYVKIGRNVQIWVRLRMGAMDTSGSSGYLYLNGLPHTVSNSSPNTSAEGGTLAINYYSNLQSTNNKVPTGYSKANTTSIFMMLVGEGGSSTNAPTNLFNANNAQIYGMMSYFTS